MEQIRTFYCWVKVPRPPSVQSTATANAAARGAAGLAGFAHRPPLVASGTQHFGHRPPPTVIGADATVMPSITHAAPTAGLSGLGFAGTISSAWWGVDDSYDGVDDDETTGVVLASFLGTRAQAITWIGSADGLKWLGDAKNYFLITFNLASNF